MSKCLNVTGDKAFAYEGGMAGEGAVIIQKPISPRELLRKVRALLDKWKADKAVTAEIHTS